MKLSESIHRNIMQPFVGGLINRFKVKGRRDVLFFEDILARYIKECEDAGHGKEMEEIGRKCTVLATDVLAPKVIRNIPVTSFFNRLAKKMWINLGLMDKLDAKKEGEKIVLVTKNEYITRVIGKNKFNVGLLEGVLGTFLGKEIRCSAHAEGDKTVYTCRIFGDIKASYEGKSRERYLKLNEVPQVKGFSLKEALINGTIKIRGVNRLYFRRVPIIPLENTLVHEISNRGTCLERVIEISYRYFKELIEPDASEKSKLNLLKNMLQVMGWGVVTITQGRHITIDIKYPPHGLQKEPDNWRFLSFIILGYIRLLDKRISLKSEKFFKNRLSLVYR